MTTARRIILHAPPPNSPLLPRFVEDCLRDRVVLLCVVGEDGERVHDEIDELVVDDGRDPDRGGGLVTTWHGADGLDEAVALAEAWTLDGEDLGPVRHVTLGAAA